MQRKKAHYVWTHFGEEHSLFLKLNAQYTSHRWMFDCCRVPGEGLDWSISYAQPGDLGDSGHIIAIRRNRLWKIDVARDGRILSTQEIEKFVFCISFDRFQIETISTRQLEHVYNNTLHDYPGVGVLTASNRDVWSKVCENIYSLFLVNIVSGLHGVSVQFSQLYDP